MEISRNRIEKRKLEVLSSGEAGIRWSGLMQIGRITRTRTIKTTGKIATETVCFITSLPQSQTTPEQLLALNRNHWAIENTLHWTKDVIMNEDRATNRKGKSPHSLAELRNFVLALIKKAGKKPKETIEYNQIYSQKLIKTLCYK